MDLSYDKIVSDKKFLGRELFRYNRLVLLCTNWGLLVLVERKNSLILPDKRTDYPIC